MVSPAAVTFNMTFNRNTPFLLSYLGIGDNMTTFYQYGHGFVIRKISQHDGLIGALPCAC